MTAGPQWVSEHDRVVVGDRAAIDLFTENVCFPATGAPQLRARRGAILIRMAIARTKALRKQGIG